VGIDIPAGSDEDPPSHVTPLRAPARSPRTKKEENVMRPRSILAGAGTLILLLIATAVAAGETLPFPGGVEFQVKNDEMTDKRLCSVFTPKIGVQVGVYGPTNAAVWVIYREWRPVAGSPAPMMRIGKENPIELTARGAPDKIDVPQAATRKLIEALYTQKKVALRWYNFPAKEQKNVEIEIGDLGEAYDHAVRVCGWPRMTTKKVSLSKEPVIDRETQDFIRASFGGRAGWNVEYMPKHASCTIQYQGSLLTIFNSRQGRPDSVLPLGEIIFLDSEGREAGQAQHTSFSPGPMTEILAAAKKVGEYGRMISKGRSEVRGASLFGLMEAVSYAEKTCNVSLQ
jgi:hypothetical protein